MLSSYADGVRGGVTDVTEVLLAVVQSGRFVADLDDTGKFLKNFCALRAQAYFESDFEKYVAGPTPGQNAARGPHDSCARCHASHDHVHALNAVLDGMPRLLP